MQKVDKSELLDGLDKFRILWLAGYRDGRYFPVLGSVDEDESGKPAFELNMRLEVDGVPHYETHYLPIGVASSLVHMGYLHDELTGDLHMMRLTADGAIRTDPSLDEEGVAELRRDFHERFLLLKNDEPDWY